MNTSAPQKEIREIADILGKINVAWVQENTGDLTQYFHKEMVIAGPDATKIGEGQEACIKSYSDFIDSAHIANFSSKEPDIDVWGNTALAFYEFEITYKMNEKEYHETGRDVFSFSRESTSSPWLAVWRMVIPISAHTE
jgi:SnoaL-like domain